MARRAQRVREFLEERAGIAIRPTEQVSRLEERDMQFERFKLDASELALHTMQYVDGRPVELVFEQRQRLAQRARIVFLRDPLAGREVEMLADFSLGNGISIPRAADDDVQEVIDEAWTDPKNEEVLTSFDAQRALSNDLKTQANIFPAAYIRGGKIRVTMLDADTIVDVVPDPEDELRPLYYVGRRRVFRWDVDRDAPAFEDLTEDGRFKVTYYRHWRNVDDAEREREMNPGLEPLPSIPDEKMDPGDARVFHVRINRLGRMHFGVPPIARSLRFYSAMNQFTEARVSKAQAAAAFVARRVRRGGPRDIMAAAGSILQQTGELTTRKPVTQPFGEGPAPGQPPIPPGSWWTGNDGDRLESLNLSSGGNEAQADAQIIRAPIAAASGFGQHYLGDASNANLATATTLELPVLMMVQAWQETLESVYRWFTDRAIEAAVQSGRLGGTTKRADHAKPLSELRIQEAEDRAEMERRTEKSLDYKFEMPYPGRRNLPDVTTAITQTVNAMKQLGLGVNETMLETLLDFLFTHGLQLTNSSELIEKIIEEWRERREEAARELAALTAAGGDPGQVPPGAAPAGGREGDDPSQYGERRGGTQPSGDLAERVWLPDDIRPLVADFEGELSAMFQEFVAGPAEITVAGLNGSAPDGG